MLLILGGVKVSKWGLFKQRTNATKISFIFQLNKGEPFTNLLQEKFYTQNLSIHMYDFQHIIIIVKSGTLL